MTSTANMFGAHACQVFEGCKETLALPLLGVPLGVKDNLCTEGVSTTAGSRILEGYLPSYDARAVSKLKHAGGIVVCISAKMKPGCLFA